MFANRPKLTEVPVDRIESARLDIVDAEDEYASYMDRHGDDAHPDDIHVLEQRIQDAEDAYFALVDFEVEAEMAHLERMIDQGLSPF